MTLPQYERTTILHLLETVPAVAPRASQPPPRLEDFPADAPLDWAPQPLARSVRTERTFRWAFVIIVALIGALLAAGIVLTRDVPVRAADARLEAFRAAAFGLDAALAELDTALGDPASPLGARAAAVETAVQDLRRVIDDPDPWQLVVDTGHPMRDIRQRAVDLAHGANLVAADASALETYLAAAGNLIVLPDLPGSASGPALADLDAALTVALGRAGASVAGLPTTVSMEAHRSSAIETIGWLSAWRDAYVSLLETADPSAVDLAADAEARVAALEATLQSALSQTRDEARADAYAARRLVSGLLVVIG